MAQRRLDHGANCAVIGHWCASHDNLEEPVRCLTIDTPQEELVGPADRGQGRQNFWHKRHRLSRSQTIGRRAHQR